MAQALVRSPDHAKEFGWLESLSPRRVRASLAVPPSIGSNNVPPGNKQILENWSNHAKLGANGRVRSDINLAPVLPGQIQFLHQHEEPWPGV